jgi:methyl-accepting chemotaxis protein
MSWFNNIGIRLKMTVGFGAVVVLTIFLSVYAWHQVGEVNRSYYELLDQSVARRQHSMEMQSAIRAIRRTLTATVMYAPTADEAAINGLYGEMRGFYSDVLTAIDGYNATLLRNAGATQEWRDLRFGLSGNVRHAIDEYIDDIFVPVNRYALAGDHIRALEVLHEGRPIVLDLIESTNYLVNMTNDAIASGSATTIQSAYNAQIMLLIISVAVVLVAIVVALLIAYAISKPIRELVSLASLVADGQLNVNIDRSKVTKDELGELTGDIYLMIETIRRIVDDIAKFSYEANTNGDIEYRIDASKYKGSYNEMIVSLNGFTDGFVKDLLTCMGVLKKVGDGDFDISLAPLPGKKVVLNNAADTLKANLSVVTTGVNDMIKAAAINGDMHFQLDASKYSGGWRELIEGLNKIALAVDEPIVEIRNSIAVMNQGKFDIPPVKGNYAGDFLAIKNAFNEFTSLYPKYMLEITENLKALAEGDLTSSINMTFNGDFDQIKSTFNSFVHTLNQTMSEIQGAASQVLQGASLIASSAMGLSNGTQEQASSVQELNATIDMINERTQQNAENAATANELSNKSASNAEDGNAAMKQMVEAMTQIKASSTDISKIVKTIQDIAFQTNLLALNASVEAARAGEHGKGFSVVADEVRTLAGRSQKAAEETTVLIEGSINRVETGSSIAKTTAESLNAIVASADEVLNIISSISASSKEQAEEISNISIGLAQISNVVQNNSAVSEETAAASEELNSQAELLRQLVSFFRL